MGGNEKEIEREKGRGKRWRNRNKFEREGRRDRRKGTMEG